MNCAWCGANADGTSSHGICSNCDEVLRLQSAQRQLDKVLSYVETQCALFAQECDELLLSQEEVAA